MNDLEDRLRRGLHGGASGLPDYAGRIRSVTRRGRQRRMATRLGAAALLVVVLGGGLAAYLILRDDGDGAVVVASGGDDADAADDLQPAGEGDAADPSGEAPGEEPVADDPSAEDPSADGPAGALESAACLGFDGYCLGVAEQDAVAAGTAAWGDEETGPIFEGTPPGPSEHVWFPATGAMVQVYASGDGLVDFIRLSQPVAADPVTPWEVSLPAGLTMGVDTLDDVLDTLGPPDRAFYGGGEGVDVVGLEYLVGSAAVTYGYIQGWDVGFLSEFDGLADAALVDAIRGRGLPLRMFMAQTLGDDEATPPTDGPLPPLALRSWGDVTLLMSQAALADVAQVQPSVFSEAYSDGEGCGYVIPQNHPGIGLMITDGEVVRIDVSDSSVRTLSGIGVGSTADDVYAAYGDQIVASPHPYLGDEGQYLTFVPRDEADAQYRLIFETGDDVVIAFRTGVMPEVDWIEGCS